MGAMAEGERPTRNAARQIVGGYKERWGAGPWLTESDYEEWVDKATGYRCMIVRHDMLGQLCGMVGVPVGHRYYGKHHDEIEARCLLSGRVVLERSKKLTHDCLRRHREERMINHPIIIRAVER